MKDSQFDNSVASYEETSISPVFFGRVYRVSRTYLILGVAAFLILFIACVKLYQYDYRKKLTET
jgi:hypothetical protein